MNREGQENGAKRGKWDESGRGVLMRLPVLKSFKERDRNNVEMRRSQNSKKFQFLTSRFGEISFVEGVLPNRVHLFSLIRKPR